MPLQSVTTQSIKIRLYVTEDLSPMRRVVLGRDQSHYLANVMRCRLGDRVAVFNGCDGAWATEIVETERRAVTLECREQVQSQSEPPDLWLCFAPIKKARTDFIAEKAAEMGCSRLVPVFTRHTNSGRVRIDRLRAHAIEAAEQCGLVSVPDVAEPVTLDVLLRDWPPGRQVMFCDESGAGGAAQPAQTALAAAPQGPWAVLTGPEGGFSPEEADRLRALPFAHAVSLGPRILRADTAAVAAMALWQAVLGDWR